MFFNSEQILFYQYKAHTTQFEYNIQNDDPSLCVREWPIFYPKVNQDAAVTPLLFLNY